MDVYDWSTGGHLSAVVTSLNRVLGQYARWYGTLYVGVTGSPELREAAHERNGWSEMVYLYRAGSRKYAYQMEKRLIAHCLSRGYSANVIEGGSGLRQYAVYYVYVLLE